MSGKIRITGGRWRGRTLSFHAIPGLRPTKAMLRQMVFNWLDNDCHALVFMDLYAGSGIMGFEALSRGALSCTFIERDPRAAHGISQACNLLGVMDRTRVLTSDVHAALAHMPVHDQRLCCMVDPPYADGMAGMPALLACLSACTSASIDVMIEHAHHSMPDVPSGWVMHKQRAQGRSGVVWLRREVLGAT